MALMTPGPLVGQVSGRIGGSVFSHNRGGAYIRNGAIPTKVVNPFTEQVRGNMSVCSRAWATLTDANREAWREYCVENPVVNRLGQTKTLSGHMAYNKLNSRIILAGGTSIDIPPTADPPDALTSLSITASLGGTVANVVFAASPLPANVCLWVWAAVTRGSGATYVGNRYRLVHKSAAAAATPADIWGDLEDRFGSLQVGDRIFIRAQTISKVTGLTSGFLFAGCDVAA